MNKIHFNNTGKIWKHLLSHLVKDGEVTEICIDENSIGSFFGVKERFTKELLGVTFKLSNPRDRLLYSGDRNLNYSYMLANFLFLFSEIKTIDFIDFYNIKGRLFTDDGKTLNAPFGYRIFNKINQIELIKKTIQKDPSTRRAVIQIYEKKDLINNSRDIPCLNNFQIFIRNNKLDLIVNMRSQSALGILPYDVFIFTMFQEALACYLGYEIGEYIHFCGSLHIYNDEFEKVEHIINKNELYSLTMPKMRVFNYQILSELFRAESEIRELIKNNTQSKINFNKYNLDQYWKIFLENMFNSFLHNNDNIVPNFKLSAQIEYDKNELIS